MLVRRLMPLFVCVLLHDAAVNAEIKTDHLAYAPFVDAIRAQDIPSIQTILKQHNNHQTFLNEGLNIAAGYGYPKLVAFFLAAGAHVHSTHLMWHALHYAVRSNSFECIKLLLAAGADINAPTWWSQVSPLFIAVENNNMPMVTFLTENGARLDLTSYWLKQTITHAAISAGNQDILQYLLSAGAPLDTRDACNETPLMYAARQGKADMVKIMLDYNPKFTQSDMDAVRKNWLESKNQSQCCIDQRIKVAELLSAIIR